jgi:hypothetical protein
LQIHQGYAVAPFNHSSGRFCGVVGGDHFVGWVVVAEVEHRSTACHQRVTRLQLGDAQAVVVTDALGDVVGFPAVIATLDPAKLFSLQHTRVFILGFSAGLLISLGHLRIQRSQFIILANALLKAVRFDFTAIK